jgi:PAS domain S-box-containing protein
MWSSIADGLARGELPQGLWRSIHWPFPARLALAVAILACAMLLRFALLTVSTGSMFVVFYPALALCFAVCGRMPGVIVTILAAVARYSFSWGSDWSLETLEKHWIDSAIFLMLSLPLGVVMANEVQTREKLKELVTTQRLLLENELIGMAKIRNRRFLWCNRKLEEILGYGPGELTGQSTRVAFADDETWSQFIVTSMPMLHVGQPHRVIAHLVTKGGEPRVVELSGWMMDPQSGDILALLDDITPRTQLSARLRVNQVFLEQTSAVASVGGWRHDLRSGTIEWSTEMFRLLDLPVDHQSSQQDPLRWFSPASGQVIDEARRNAIDHGTPFDLEAEVITASCRRFWGRVVAAPEIEDGKTVRLTGALQDITRSHEIAAALRASEREQAAARVLLETLFRHAKETMVVVRVDQAGESPRFFYEVMNPVWDSFTGLTAADWVGREPQNCLPQSVADVVVGGWTRCVRERRPVIFPFPSVQPDGKEWEASVVPILNDAGEVTHLVAIGRDQSERNKAEKQARQMQRLEATSQLTAGMAHDFNNILQSILIIMDDLYERSDIPEDMRRRVRIALDASERGAMLVRRLLAFSRQQVLAPSLVDPSAVFTRLKDAMRLAVGSRIVINIVTDPEVWFVRADAAQLDDCLLNLGINARDAMNGMGTLTCAVRNIGADAARAQGLPTVDHVCFAVTDTGTGMSPEVLARALEPFFTTKPIGQGSGLGLSMVQGFARQSGGDVRIESTPGQGMTVSIWLPRATDAGDQKSQRDAAGPARTPLVLVDDNPAVLEPLKEYLDNAGFDVAAFDLGVAALEYLKTDHPCALLITDQSMPGMSGTDLIEQVQAIRPELPALIITGFDKVSGLHEMSSRIAILTKPFRMREVLEKIRQLTGGQAVSPRA